MDSYLADIESQMITADIGSDLTTVNLNLGKQQVRPLDYLLRQYWPPV